MNKNTLSSYKPGEFISTPQVEFIEEVEESIEDEELNVQVSKKELKVADGLLISIPKEFK